MNMTKEQVKSAADVVRELQRELAGAYRGIGTLPADHPARVAFNAADEWLRTWPE